MLPDQLGPQHPADAGATDEAEESDSPVGHELRGDGVVGDERLAPAGRQARFAQDVDQTQARQRRVACRLDDDRATRGDGRPHLMNDQVQRMVERAHCHDHADGLTLGERNAPGFSAGAARRIRLGRTVPSSNGRPRHFATKCGPPRSEIASKNCLLRARHRQSPMLISYIAYVRRMTGTCSIARRSSHASARTVKCALFS